MMSKIQNLNGTHNNLSTNPPLKRLFMMSKIQNLNGTHNKYCFTSSFITVVYDVKDTKFEWNSQLRLIYLPLLCVVYDYKDTKFE